MGRNRKKAGSGAVSPEAPTNAATNTMNMNANWKPFDDSGDSIIRRFPDRTQLLVQTANNSADPDLYAWEVEGTGTTMSDEGLVTIPNSRNVNGTVNWNVVSDAMDQWSRQNIQRYQYEPTERAETSTPATPAPTEQPKPRQTQRASATSTSKETKLQNLSEKIGRLEQQIDRLMRPPIGVPSPRDQYKVYRLRQDLERAKATYERTLNAP